MALTTAKSLSGPSEFTFKLLVAFERLLLLDSTNVIIGVYLGYLMAPGLDRYPLQHRETPFPPLQCCYPLSEGWE